MNKINKILYASDLSENSAYAFKVAADLASKYDAMIDIIHVIEDMPAGAKAMLSSYLDKDQMDKFNNQDAAAKEKIKSRLTVFCDNVRKGDKQCEFRVESIDVITGNPASEILNAAKKKGSDAIVMGSNSQGRIEHAFLGNVAEKVLRNAKIPVFFVPLPEGKTDLNVPAI